MRLKDVPTSDRSVHPSEFVELDGRKAAGVFKECRFTCSQENRKLGLSENKVMFLQACKSTLDKTENYPFSSVPHGFDLGRPSFVAESGPPASFIGIRMHVRDQQTSAAFQYTR